MPTKLGQNFLKNKLIVDKIISSANLKADDFVLEIGPGKGILTEELARNAGRVVAIEIDKSLSEELHNKLRNYKNVEIIEGDILKINLNELLGSRASKYKIIANIPYYITSPIIRLFLENETPPSEMILMVQKEVAERIVAKSGEMSILAVSVQYYADAEILFEVGKVNFEPAPEVDSAVIRIAPFKPSPPRLDSQDNLLVDARRAAPLPGRERGDYTEKFFKLVKIGFSTKRKTLVNNLSNGLHLEKSIVEEKLKTAGFSPTVRAQELSVKDWKRLSDSFN